MKLLTQFFIIYNWAAICILLFFLFSIARFFERRLSQKNSPTPLEPTRRYYPFFLAPLGLFAVSALLYVWDSQWLVGNLVADILRIFGGVILIGAGYAVLNTMVRGKS